MKNIITILTVAILGIFLTNCSSTPKDLNPENSPDVVLERIDGLKERPEWLKESRPFWIESETVYSLGSTELAGDQRVDAGYRIAQNNAKAAIAGQIEQRLSFVFQNAEEGTGFDANQAKFIGAEASELTTSAISLDKRYYEKIASTTDNGQRITKYKIFALVKMPERDLKIAINKALNKTEKKGLTKKFQEQVDQHWDKFVTGE